MIHFTPRFFSIDSRDCALKESGWSGDKNKKIHAGEKTNFLCTVKIPEDEFKRDCSFCAVSGYGVERGAAMSVEESFCHRACSTLSSV